MGRDTLKEGAVVHGFEVRRVTDLPDLNAGATLLEHLGTGARYLHLAAADEENLFAVGFRTPPRDSTGVAHILEHTTLCGSRRYPVHDPFFAMLRRSLSTFMNAMTADDWTLYPFSSQNRTDFYNLMGVYLDATFFPLLREGDFRQEGHRLDFEDPANPDSPLLTKGVVYNEMKGYMTDPSSLLRTRMAEHLYPTTPYGRNAGGEPAAIPDLTWEQLREFHATCYHPSNAYFFSYGNLPLAPHLAAIEEQVLGGFERKQVDTAVGLELPFASPRRVELGYPLDPGESPTGKSLVQVAWLGCEITDGEERLAFQVLSELLLGNPAAPLYRALIDSKLGTSLAPGSGFDDENRQTAFAVGLQGTEPEAAQRIEALVLETLEILAREGFAADRIHAALHQLEFELREVKGDHYPYALGLLMKVMGPWIHGGDPVRPLLLVRDIERLRERLGREAVFEDLIRRRLLQNPHRVTLALRPDPALPAREREQEAARLAAVRGALLPAQVEEIRRKNRELEEAQNAEEDLSVLPCLALAEIPREEREVPWEEGLAAHVPVRWFPQPTNGIVYLHGHVGACPGSWEQSEYLPVFCTCFDKIGAAGQPYTVLAERIVAATGGIGANVSVLDLPAPAGAFITSLFVGGKALAGNAEAMLDILRDLLLEPDFEDLERLRVVLNQRKAALENSIPSLGHRYAARAAAASLGTAGRLREVWSGLAHIRTVKRLAALAPEALAAAAERLRAVAAGLLQPGTLQLAVTGEARDMEGLRAPFRDFAAALQRGGAGGDGGGPAPADPAPVRIGYAASVPVSYVARVYPCVPFAHADAPGLAVLAKLLRSGYLHREIREKGGAYGGMAAYGTETGHFSVLSYRDPHIARTVGVFDDAAQWAAAGSFPEEAVRESILGVFSDLDRPLSPGSRGTREFAFAQQGISRELRQQFREGVLATDHRRLRSLAARYLVEGRPGSALAVVANSEALEQANRELGDDTLCVERI